MNPKMVFWRCCNTCDAGTPPNGYSFEVWRPGLRPPGTGGAAFLVWSTFHRLRVFRNREYRVIIVRCGSEVVHQSCVFPGYFRFPFMATADVQVGDTWTSPDHRCKGLATWALMYARETLATGGRRIWYVSQEDNVGSIRAAEKAGFALVGRGSKKPRLGSLMLGYYDLEESLE